MKHTENEHFTKKIKRGQRLHNSVRLAEWESAVRSKEGVSG